MKNKFVRNRINMLEASLHTVSKTCAKRSFKQVLLTVLLSAVCVAGCVSRKLTINSQPQGARVFFDYKQVGETPCSFDFIYYGAHHLELVREGFDNFNTTVKLKAPIYEYIPLDFFSEHILPFHFKDEHAHTFSLTPGVSRAGYIIPERKKEEEGKEEEE